MTEANVNIKWSLKYKGQTASLETDVKITDLADIPKSAWGGIIEDALKAKETEAIQGIEAKIQRAKELEG
jgi:hypothetical protein